MLLWYTARGAGLAALVLLTVATAGGALQSVRRLRPDRRVLLQYAHRAAAVCGLGVVALHVTTILLDGHAGVGVVGAFVPLASSYRPWQVALGTVALYGLLVVAGVGAARRSFAARAAGARRWRAVHLSAYGCWAVALTHGLTTGSDVGRPWVVGLAVACAVSVVVAALVRLTADAPPAPRPALRAMARVPEVTR